ncbi:MAG: SRPBCC family protein [Actinomycetota bacterium]
MEKPLYFVEREYPVTIPTLWEAWVNPTALEKWYSPVFLNVVPGSATSETVVGGSWAIAVDVSANGFNAYFWGLFSEVELHKKLAHTMNYSQDELEFAARIESPEAHKIVIDFEDRGASSWVRFSQFGEMPSEQADASREGMESYLDNLELFLKGHN